MTDTNSQMPANQEEQFDETLSALREDYAQSAAPVLSDTQPEPKVGRELKSRRFPRFVTYLMGMMAVGMLLLAIFLFNTQTQPGAAMDAAVETAVEYPADPNQPAPPFLAEPTAPAEIIPSPPEPTPWPTPPIAADSPGPDEN